MPFRLPPIRFTPTFVPTLAAICALALTLYLGHWQQGRAAEKRAIQAEFESRAAAPPIVLGAAIRDPLAWRFARASARGVWVPDRQIFLDNKFDHDLVGYHVITPLKIDGTNRHLLVNRGWVARGTSYPIPPSVWVPPGPVTVEGVLSLPGTRFLELAPSTVQGSVWQNLTVERFREATRWDVLPLILLEKRTGAPLRPVSELADARVEKHVEYMLTWYSLAATVIALWVVLNVRIDQAVQSEASNRERNEK